MMNWLSGPLYKDFDGLKLNSEAMIKSAAAASPEGCGKGKTGQARARAHGTKVGWAHGMALPQALPCLADALGLSLCQVWEISCLRFCQKYNKTIKNDQKSSKNYSEIYQKSTKNWCKKHTISMKCTAQENSLSMVQAHHDPKCSTFSTDLGTSWAHRLHKMQ